VAGRRCLPWNGSRSRPATRVNPTVGLQLCPLVDMVRSADIPRTDADRGITYGCLVSVSLLVSLVVTAYVSLLGATGIVLFEPRPGAYATGWPLAWEEIIPSGGAHWTPQPNREHNVFCHPLLLCADVAFYFLLITPVLCVTPRLCAFARRVVAGPRQKPEPARPTVSQRDAAGKVRYRCAALRTKMARGPQIAGLPTRGDSAFWQTSLRRGGG